MVGIVGLHCGEIMLGYIVGYWVIWWGYMVGSVELHGGECWDTWWSVGLHCVT